MEEVKEPQNYNTNHCDRCSKDYCSHCVDFETVDFNIKQDNRNWNGEDVCPWCYNQLLQVKKFIE